MVGIWACLRCRGGWRRVCSARWLHTDERPNRAGRKGDPNRGGCSRAVNLPASLAAEQGPTTRILYGPVQLSASLALSTLASVFAFTPWWMVEAELYFHAQPPEVELGAGRSASARAEFLHLTRETVRAWCARTMSFARISRSVASSQQVRRSRARIWCPTTPVRSKTVRGTRGSLAVWTSLGAIPVAGLIELL